MDVNKVQQIPSLTSFSLITAAASMWTNKEISKNLNGVVYMEDELKSVKNAVFKLPICASLKKELSDMTERVGYELYRFMTWSPLVELCLCNSAAVKWTAFGLIDEKKMFDLKYKTDNLLNSFQCACIFCDENKVVEIWKELTEEQREKTRKSRATNLFVKYWVCLLESKMDEFASIYGLYIVDFDRNRSVKSNMFIYSVQRALNYSIAYFYGLLTLAEINSLADSLFETKPKLDDFLYYHILDKVFMGHVNYICRLFEIPLPNHRHNQMILNRLPRPMFQYLIAHVIQNVNSFGDLHCTIFREIILTVDYSVKAPLLEDFDYSVLILLAKGRLEPILQVMDEKIRKKLFDRMNSRLLHCHGLSQFTAVCMNSHHDKLKRLLDILAYTEQNREFFKSRLLSLQTGEIYEN